MNRRSHEGKACGTGEDTIPNVEYYIEYLVTALNYTRMLPGESFRSNNYKILLLSMAMSVLILLVVVLVLSELMILTINFNLELFASVIGATVLHAAGAIKWCYCIYNNREVFDIVMKLERCHTLCQCIDDSEEGQRLYKETMEHARYYCNRFICCWIFVTTYGVLHWCLNPLLMRLWEDEMNTVNRTLDQRGLPYIAWNLWNIDNIYNYICLYFMQTVAGVASVFGTACHDAFYISMVIVICIQLHHVNTVLIKIDFDNKPKAAFNLEKKLKNCMDYHVEIIKFLEMLQTFTSPTMFVQCVQTLLILCLVSFEASAIRLTSTNIFKLWSLFEYFLCASVQLYLFCYLASQLQHLGWQLTQSVYGCGWELTFFEKKKQSHSANKHYDVDRLVQTIVIQAQKPIILTGGPFYVLSLETFRIIISMAVSNSVMLRTISDNVE